MSDIKAADLNRNHLGQVVTVARGDTVIRDTLRGVSHVADIINDHNLFIEVPTYSLGRTETTLTFVNAGEVRVAGNDDVIVQETR